jgi:serine/threonine-protein kinase RsbW
MADVSHNAGPVERVVELHLPSRLGYEKVAMDAAASLARRMGFSADRVDALRTALAEAITNAIEHGNAHDAQMRVLVMLTVRPSELVVSVADQGCKPLELARLSPPPCHDFPYQNPDGTYDPSVVLDFEYTVLMPRRMG